MFDELFRQTEIETRPLTLIFKFGIKSSVYTYFVLKMFRIGEGGKGGREEGGRRKSFSHLVIHCTCNPVINSLTH